MLLRLRFVGDRGVPMSSTVSTTANLVGLVEALRDARSVAGASCSISSFRVSKLLYLADLLAVRGGDLIGSCASSSASVVATEVSRLEAMSSIPSAERFVAASDLKMRLACGLILSLNRSTSWPFLAEDG